MKFYTFLNTVAKKLDNASLPDLRYGLVHCVHCQNDFGLPASERAIWKQLASIIRITPTKT